MTSTPTARLDFNPLAQFTIPYTTNWILSAASTSNGHVLPSNIVRLPFGSNGSGPQPPANGNKPRRDVSDVEVDQTVLKIRNTTLGREVDKLVHETFSGMVRESGTTYEQHADIVAKGSVRLALRDHCNLDECIQQYAIAKMHDLEEDVPGSIEKIRKLKQYGLRDDAVEDIQRLTKLENEPYFDRVDKIITSRRAIRAKKPDSEHNSLPFEQQHNRAKGIFKGGEVRYAVCLSLYDAILEGRCDPKIGVKGYLKSLGQDTLTQENRPIFAKGFSDPDDILDIIDSRASLVKEIKIPTLNWRGLAARMGNAFRRAGNKIAPGMIEAPVTLPPMDADRTLNATTQNHPTRSSI
jgi:hypothetical protein